MMSQVFDSLIYSFLIGDALLMAVVAFLWIRKSRGRRRRNGWLAVFLLSFGWLVIFYGSFIEPRMLVVTRETIWLDEERRIEQERQRLEGVYAEELVQSVRVALVSDFHVGPYKQDDYVARAVQKIHELKPDLVLIAGDFVFDHKDESKFLGPLRGLTAGATKPPLGVYAVLGNHDYGGGELLALQRGEGNRVAQVRNELEALGIEVLVNRGKVLNKYGKDFYLLGVDELWTGRASVQAALGTLGVINASQNSAPHPSILLSHNPDIVVHARNAGIDLVLAGHTHGGQIRLPLIGPVPEIPDALGRKYDRGLFEFGETQLFITSGIGEMGPRARLLVPPEIALLEVEL